MSKKNIGEADIVGTCLKMCPDNELDHHKEYERSAFEFDPVTNKFDEDLAITAFHRSEGGKDYQKSDIRPLPILQKTMKHILHYVIGQRTGTSEKTREIDMYMYVKGRFRAISSDINVQHLEGEEVIEIYQTMILFFVWSGVRFPDQYGVDSFDSYSNQQILNDFYFALERQYDIFLQRTGIHHPYEPDFRSLHLLLYASNDAGQFMSYLKSQISDDLLTTPPIQNLIRIRQAIISNDFSAFLKIINSSSIQFSSMAIQSVNKFYYDAFRNLRISFSYFNFEKELFTSYLDLPDEYFDEFAKNFDIKPKGELLFFDLSTSPDPSKPPTVPLPSKFKEKFESIQLLNFLNMKPSAGSVIPKKAEITNESESEISDHKIQNEEPDFQANESPSQSSSQESSSLVSSPILNPVASTNIEDSKPDFRKDEYSSSSVLASPLPIISDRESSFEPEEEDKEIKIIQSTFSMKVKKFTFKQNLDFKSMVPHVLPPLCFISVVVYDSDDSPSALFSRDFFNRVSTSDPKMREKVIYLNNFKMKSISSGKNCHVYISIVRKQCQKYMNSVGAILNCEDTTMYESGDDRVFTFTLYDKMKSPELVLNNLMRKCIEKALVEFKPVDLTEIVKSILFAAFEIALNPKWSRASCNSVLELFNNVIDQAAFLFESEIFLSFLLPFIHEQFGINNMKQFIASIRKMKFPLILKDESVKPIQNSSWPIFLRDNMIMKEAVPFIAPVSIKFNPQELIDLAVRPFRNSKPFEYVENNESDLPYNNVIYSLNCDFCD